MNVRFKPLEVWPKAPTTRKKSDKFSADYVSTLNLIEAEILKLEGSDVIVQGFIPSREIRNDGWPISNARVPAHQSGVIISFHTKKLGNLSYHADAYDSWKANLRAIGMTLKALRDIQRHGAAAGDEHYIGFQALNAPEETTRAAMAVLIELSKCSKTVDQVMRGQNVPAFIDILRKEAVKIVHPDIPGGSIEKWDKLIVALEILKGVDWT